jgi:hypothetical protein
MRAFCGSLWEADGLTKPAAFFCADDLVIIDGDQAHGLFARFTEVALEDLQARGQVFFFSLSALRVTRLQSLASGSQSVRAMEPLGRRSPLAATLDLCASAIEKVPVLWRAGKALARRKSAAAAFQRLESQARSEGDMRLEICAAAVPAEMAALIARLPYDGRIRHVRDERFFAWRYRSPLHQYRFVYAWRGTTLAGYLVVQRALSAHANPRRVNIVDCEAESGAVRATLLDMAMRAGGFEELVTWSSSADDESTRVLGAAGFAPIDAEQTARGLPCILIRPVAPGSEASALALGSRRVMERANWDLRMAYTSYA